MEKMYSTRVIAVKLGVHIKTVRRWIEEGQLKAVKLRGTWRVSESNLRSFVVPGPAPHDELVHSQ